MTNLQKEFRTLAFPAGLILFAVLAGAWAATGDGGILGYRNLLFRGALLAFFLGTPLLAALPFGAEFQHKTIVLLLSQPASRTRIWFEKWIAAVIVVAVLGGIELTFLALRAPGEVVVLAALWFIVLVACSAPLWTLLARSTIGGLTFTMSAMMMVELGANYVLYRMTGTELDQDVFGRAPFLDLVRILYAAATLAAGWMAFLRFQAVATGLGAVSAGQSHTGWAVLRARRSGAIANLVRKELMLQRPAFLVAALFGIGWIVCVALVAARMMPPRFADVLPAMLFAGHIPLVIVLAGTVPVGEETSLGLRDWHLTLPISARVQWAIKLLVAVAVVVLLAFVLPGLFSYAAGRVTDGEIRGVEVFRSPTFQLLVIGAVLLAFWSSTIFGDTLKASLATGAAVLGVGVCAALGSRIADWIPLRQTWWYTLLIHYEWPPNTLAMEWMFQTLTGLAFFTMAAVGLPQSYAAFRRVRVGRRAAVRSCALLFVVALATFTLVSNTVESTASYQFRPFREVREALLGLPVSSLPQPGDSRSVTLDELDRVRPLSPDTMRWLAHTPITVERMTTGDKGWYVARMQFPRDRRFVFIFRQTP